MAKLISPLYSLEARGSLCNVLTFSSRKSGNQVRFQHRPHDRTTAARTEQRNFFAEGKYTWNLLSEEQKNNWKSKVSFENPLPYNAYLSHYINAIISGTPCPKLSDLSSWFGHFTYYLPNTSLVSPIGSVLHNGYIYSVGSSQYASILRVLESNPSVSETIPLTEGDQWGSGLYTDGTDLYIFVSISPRRLLRVNNFDFSNIDSFRLDNPPSGCVCMSSDDTYLWMPFYENPGRLIRALKSDPNNFVNFIFSSNERNFQTVYDDGTYLWLGCFSTPGVFVRVPKSDPGNYSVYNLSTSQNNVTGITGDDTYIYLTLYTSPGIIIRALRADPNIREVYTLPSFHNRINGLISDNNYLYFATYSPNIYLYRVLKSDPNIRDYITLDTEINHLSYISNSGTYLFITAQTATPSLYKFWL